EEAGRETAADARLDVAVEADGIAVLEDEGHVRRLRGEAADGLLLAIVEELRTPDQAAIARLAERRVAIREIGAGQVALAAVLAVDLGGVRVAAAEIDAVLV